MILSGLFFAVLLLIRRIAALAIVLILLPSLLLLLLLLLLVVVIWLLATLVLGVAVSRIVIGVGVPAAVVHILAILVVAIRHSVVATLLRPAVHPIHGHCSRVCIHLRGKVGIGRQGLFHLLRRHVVVPRHSRSRAWGQLRHLCSCGRERFDRHGFAVQAAAKALARHKRRRIDG